MKDQTVTVFVRISGQAGTGKTTLAVKLARVLKEYGIESETWEYDDSCQQDLTDEALNGEYMFVKFHIIKFCT